MNYKVLLNQISWIINQKLKKASFLVNIHYLFYSSEIYAMEISDYRILIKSKMSQFILTGLYRGIKPFERRYFLNNIRFFLSGREKILNSFRSKIFPIKSTRQGQASEKVNDPTSEPAPERKTVPTPEFTEKALEQAPESTPKPAPNLSVFDTSKRKKAKAKTKISSPKLCEEFFNEIENEEKKINNEIFQTYSGYETYIQQNIYIKSINMKMRKL